MEQICGNCEYYTRHFVNLSGYFRPIDHGHCRYPGLKNREADHKACKYFEERKEKDEIQVIEIKVEIKTL